MAKGLHPRHPRDEKVSVKERILESSSSCDMTESTDVAKECPPRAVPDSVTTPGPKLKPQSIIKEIKRGRNFDYERGRELYFITNMLKERHPSGRCG